MEVKPGMYCVLRVITTVVLPFKIKMKFSSYLTGNSVSTKETIRLKVFREVLCVFCMNRTESVKYPLWAKFRRFYR
jgi:hypothetical protein